MVYLMPFKYFLLHSLSHLLFIGKLWSLESKLWNTLHTIWILNFINRGRIISDGYDCFTYECVVSCMLLLPLPSRPQMWACIWLAAAAPEPSPWCWAAPSSAWTSACAVCSGVANVDKQCSFGCAITRLKIMQILQVGGVLETSGPPLHDGHTDF